MMEGGENGTILRDHTVWICLSMVLEKVFFIIIYLGAVVMPFKIVSTHFDYGKKKLSPIKSMTCVYIIIFGKCEAWGTFYSIIFRKIVTFTSWQVILNFVNNALLRCVMA